MHRSCLPAASSSALREPYRSGICHYIPAGSRTRTHPAPDPVHSTPGTAPSPVLVPLCLIRHFYQPDKSAIRYPIPDAFLPTAFTVCLSAPAGAHFVIPQFLKILHIYLLRAVYHAVFKLLSLYYHIIRIICSYLAKNWSQIRTKIHIHTKLPGILQPKAVTCAAFRLHRKIKRSC